MFEIENTERKLKDDDLPDIQKLDQSQQYEDSNAIAKPNREQNITHIKNQSDKSVVPIKKEQQKEKLNSVIKNLKFKDKVKTLQQHSKQFRYRNLNDDDFQLIGDKSYFTQSQIDGKEVTKRRVYQQNYHKEEKLSLFIIDPDGLFNVFLNLFLGIFEFLNFAIFPIEATFGTLTLSQELSDLRQNIKIFSCFLFSVKFISSFFTAYTNKNTFVESHRKIAKHYLESSFCLDFLLILQCAININPQLQILGFVYLLNISNTASHIEKFCVRFNIEERYLEIYNTTRLIIIILSVAHYNCLIFHAISQTGGQKVTWVERQNLVGAEWHEIYERALYFMIITMITVGFGDIVPVTSRERIILIFITLFSCFLFGYAVNTVGSIFQQRDFKQIQLKKKKYKVSNYLKNRGVSGEIQRKILREVQYLSLMEERGLFDDSINKVLDRVSNELKDEVKTNISLKILRGSQLLCNTLSLKCMEEYSKYMREMTLTPGEILFQKGDYENNIFFINKGEVELFLQNSNQDCQIILRRMKEKSYLGEFSFLRNAAKQVSVRSVGVTHVIYFCYSDLKDILVNNPVDFERLHMQRDQIQFSIRNTENSDRCFVCKELGHIMTKCPRITFTLDQDFVWKKYLFEKKSSKRNINTIVRDNKQNQLKTLTDNPRIRNDLIRFRKNLINLYIEELIEGNENNPEIQNLMNIENQEVRGADVEFYRLFPKIVVNSQNEFVIDNDNQSLLEFGEKEEAVEPREPQNPEIDENNNKNIFTQGGEKASQYCRKLSMNENQGDQVNSNYQQNQEERKLNRIDSDLGSDQVSEEDRINKFKNFNENFKPNTTINKQLKKFSTLDLLDSSFYREQEFKDDTFSAMRRREKIQKDSQQFPSTDNLSIGEKNGNINLQNSKQLMKNSNQPTNQHQKSKKFFNKVSTCQVNYVIRDSKSFGGAKPDVQINNNENTVQQRSIIMPTLKFIDEDRYNPEPIKIGSFNNLSEELQSKTYKQEQTTEGLEHNNDDAFENTEMEIDCLRQFNFYFKQNNFSNIISIMKLKGMDKNFDLKKQRYSNMEASQIIKLPRLTLKQQKQSTVVNKQLKDL